MSFGYAFECLWEFLGEGCIGFVEGFGGLLGGKEGREGRGEGGE